MDRVHDLLLKAIQHIIAPLRVGQEGSEMHSHDVYSFPLQTADAETAFGGGAGGGALEEVRWRGCVGGGALEEVRWRGCERRRGVAHVQGFIERFVRAERG
jgi:hypothetical protein